MEEVTDVMWLKIDDGFPDHPKVVKAGPLAGWLYLCGLCYCKRQTTDGFIPAEVVPRLSTVPRVDREAERLVEVGLWEPAEGGYVVHDYLDWNPSRSETNAWRQNEANRKRRVRADTGGEMSARPENVRADISRTPSPRPENVRPLEVEVEKEITKAPLHPTAQSARTGVDDDEDERQSSRSGVDISDLAARVGLRDHQRRLEASGSPVFDPGAHLRKCVERRLSDPLLLGLLDDHPDLSSEVLSDMYFALTDPRGSTAKSDGVSGPPSSNPAQRSVAPRILTTVTSNSPHPAVRVRSECERCEGLGVRPLDDEPDTYTDCDCKVAEVTPRGSTVPPRSWVE